MMDAGEWEKAIGCFRKAIELDEFTYSARLSLGKCCLQLGRYADAMEQAEWILVYLPEDIAAMKLKGKAGEAAERE